MELDIPLSTQEYRSTVVNNIVSRNLQLGEALGHIEAAVGALENTHAREHQLTHVPRWLKMVAMFPDGPGDLVDIAAAPFYVNALKTKGWNIIPVESLSIDYEKDQLPHPDSRFDAALIGEVIEHFVLDPLFCLVELNRVLKKGGLIVITTPNAASWFSIYEALHQRHPSRWPVYSTNAASARHHIHAREYTCNELRILVEAAGFDVSEISTLDYGIAPPHAPIAGFDTENRGETIYLSARKTGAPRLRAVAPIYLENKPFVGYGA